MLEKFSKNGKTYCGCGTEISDSDAMCPLCTESYEVDDKMRREYSRYGAGLGTSRNLVGVSEKVAWAIGVARARQEEW